jgi:hypothetical protein
LDYAKRVAVGLIAGIIASVLIGAGVWLLSVAIPYKMRESDTAASALIQWIYHTRLSSGIRESLWVFPIIEGTHLLGIALSAGALCWFDLRLLGLALRDEPISRIWKYVMPVAFVGFGLVFITGFLLFWAEAATAYRSLHFWIKMGLILIAGANALIFESKLHPKMADWDSAALPPMSARVAGIVSLVLWTAIIVTGRTMAYSF